MARGSKCPDTGLKRKYCFCSKCITIQNNAIQRSGNLRRDRKGTNPHSDGNKSSRNPKRFRY